MLPNGRAIHVHWFLQAVEAWQRIFWTDRCRLAYAAAVMLCSLFRLRSILCVGVCVKTPERVLCSRQVPCCARERDAAEAILLAEKLFMY